MMTNIDKFNRFSRAVCGNRMPDYAYRELTLGLERLRLKRLKAFIFTNYGEIKTNSNTRGDSGENQDISASGETS